MLLIQNVSCPMIPNMTLEHLAHQSANQIIESWFSVVSLIFDSRKLNISIIISLEMEAHVQKEI